MFKPILAYAQIHHAKLHMYLDDRLTNIYRNMAASSLEYILAQVLGPKARVGYKLIVIGCNQILGYYISGYWVCLTRLSDNSVTNLLPIVEGLMA